MSSNCLLISIVGGRGPWKVLGREGDKWQSGGLTKGACDKWLEGLGGPMEESKGPCPFIGELLVVPWTRQWLPRGCAEGWSPWLSLLGWVIWTGAEGLYQSSPAEKWMKIEFPRENRGAVIQTEINQKMPQRRGEQVSNSRRIIKETVSKCKWWKRKEDKVEMIGEGVMGEQGRWVCASVEKEARVQDSWRLRVNSPTLWSF